MQYTMWSFAEAFLPIACRLSKWLVISRDDSMGGRLCTDSSTAPPSVLELSAVMPEEDSFLPIQQTEIVMSTAAHAQILLQNVTVERVFAVQTFKRYKGRTALRSAQLQAILEAEDGQGTGTCSRKAETAGREFVNKTMIQIYRAHESICHPSKLSMVTFGAETPAGEHRSDLYPSGAESPQGGVIKQGSTREDVTAECASRASASLARTLFMENRVASGPSIDIWPPSLPVDAKVRFYAAPSLYSTN